MSTQSSAEALFWTRRVSARELSEESGLADRRRAAARGRWRADVVTEEPVSR
jgi:hypothetical protein